MTPSNGPSDPPSTRYATYDGTISLRVEVEPTPTVEKPKKPIPKSPMGLETWDGNPTGTLTLEQYHALRSGEPVHVVQRQQNMGDAA